MKISFGLIGFSAVILGIPALSFAGGVASSLISLKVPATYQDVQEDSFIPQRVEISKSQPTRLLLVGYRTVSDACPATKENPGVHDCHNWSLPDIMVIDYKNANTAQLAKKFFEWSASIASLEIRSPAGKITPCADRLPAQADGVPSPIQLSELQKEAQAGKCSFQAEATALVMRKELEPPVPFIKYADDFIRSSSADGSDTVRGVEGVSRSLRGTSRKDASKTEDAAVKPKTVESGEVKGQQNAPKPAGKVDVQSN